MKPTFNEKIGLCDIDSLCDKSSSLSHICPASIPDAPLIKTINRCSYLEIQK